MGISLSQKISRLAQKVLGSAVKAKKELSQVTLQHTLERIRTDNWDEVTDKDLYALVENYRIEATDLLEAVYWMLKIAGELEVEVQKRGVRNCGKR